MNTKHQITEEELLEVTMAFEDQAPVTFSEFVSSFVSAERSQILTPITDENGNGGDPHHCDSTAAGVFLRSLEAEGYVIVKKNTAPAPLREHPDYLTH